jgi:hypothetical protein
MKTQPIKLSLATEVSLSAFAFAAVALAALMYLEHGKFNYAMEHLDNVARRSTQVTEEVNMEDISLRIERHKLAQSITNLNAQMTEMEKRVNLLETRPSPFLTNHEYTIRITPASPPPINTDQTIKVESAPMPFLNLGNK